MREFEGATPEAFEKRNVHNQWIADHCPSEAGIYIAPARHLYDIVLHKEQALKNQKIVTFNTEQEAMKWIQSHEESKSRETFFRG